MLLPSPLLYFDGAPFTRPQAAACGWSGRQLQRLVGDGLIRRILKGVYVDALVPDSIEQRAAALCLITPADMVISRSTAAWLFGVDTFALGKDGEVLAIETVRPRFKRSARWQQAVGHSQTVLPGDITTFRGLRVTTPTATAVHLARHLPRPFALSAIDSMMHAGILTPDQLAAAVERYPKHPGIKQARELVAYADPLTESPGESWLRLRLLDAGFPPPQAQVPVSTANGERRIDLGYPDRLYNDRKIGLEYDSDQWHSGAAADLRDSNRRSELEDFGWLILPVRRGHVWGRSPELEYAVGELLGIEPRLPRRW